MTAKTHMHIIIIIIIIIFFFFKIQLTNTSRAFLRDTGTALPVWLLQGVRCQKIARDVLYDTVRPYCEDDAKMDLPLRKTGVPLADTVSAGDATRHFLTPSMTQKHRVSSYYCARYHAKTRGRTLHNSWIKQTGVTTTVVTVFARRSDDKMAFTDRQLSSTATISVTKWTNYSLGPHDLQELHKISDFLRDIKPAK